MKIAALIVSLISVISPMLVQADTWNPVPPVQIPGTAIALPVVIPSYGSLLNEFLVSWIDGVTNDPFYATFNGMNWSTPAAIPGGLPAMSAVFPFFSSTLGEWLVTWVDLASHSPMYATFNGAIWSLTAAIPGGLPVGIGSPVLSSFDPIVGEFLVVWIDSASGNPFYTTFNGTTWSSPTPIPGSSPADPNAAVFPVYASLSGEFLVTWLDAASELPFYALFNGTSWTTPAGIPGSSPVVSGAPVLSSYDSLLGLFLVTWPDAVSNTPYFAIYNGTSWTAPATIPGSAQAVPFVFSSFDSSSGEFLATWVDIATFTPFYATFSGTTWSAPTTIPGSSMGFPVISSAAPDKFLVIWSSFSSLPFYSTFAPSLPSVITGLADQNRSLLQIELFNVIRWTAPGGMAWTPALYLLYRNPGLTDLAGSVPAAGPLEFIDHNRQRETLYAYYLVAVDTLNVQHFLGSVTVRSE